MFGRKKKQTEPLPWYRTRNYKGNLTETEKRELNSFRHRESEGGEHPSTSYADLPEDVQSYLSKIQIEHYDLIQERLAGRVLLVSGCGAFLLANYFGWIPADTQHSGWALAYGAVLLVAPWVYYPIKWRKNADKFSEEQSPKAFDWNGS